MANSENLPINPINITLRLLDVKCIFFELSEYAKTNTYQPAFDAYEFQFKLQASVLEEEKEFVINLDVKLFEKRGNIKYELSNLVCHLKFALVNYNEIILKRDNIIQIPDQLIITCAGIVVSSARGMFAVNLNGTLYSNAVVPLIDPKIFIPQKSLPIA
jgi:hypothetical protein